MIEMIIEQRRRNLGGGMNVGRQAADGGTVHFLRPYGAAGPWRRIDRGVDVRPHPHIGPSTVTYLFSGEIMHRDSLGYELAIRTQEVNWMDRRQRHYP